MERYLEIELSVARRAAQIPATLTLPAADKPCPLVVFAHGFSGSRHEGGGYRRIAKELALRGIASVRMDFPGCGDSTESFRLCTLSNMAGDARACAQYVLARYPLDASHLGVVGMSLGGRVAMELFNGGDPAFSAAALIAPAADNDSICGVIGTRAEWDRAYAVACRDGFAPIPCYFGGPDLELSPAWFEDFARMDTLSCASKDARPVTVVYASDDAVVPPHVSLACAAVYGAATIEIGGDGHSYGCYSDRSDVLERLAVCVADAMETALLA